ncbi:hypothetical protein KUCAC02_014006 [Chaenocephalus aceratus]|uniref:Uncharacterized protein n=1 Tax=Chaenocephalus aceratus TaxID=36190 RepID=A0ACB9WEA5_CHAAC|nr:hypothetical protein KUCAC02_014006 [Chaenocephalus aceratus]
MPMHQRAGGGVTTRFLEFQKYGPMFSLIKPDDFDGHELDVSLMDRPDTGDMEMQLIELKTSTLPSYANSWKTQQGVITGRASPPAGVLYQRTLAVSGTSQWL